MYNGIMIAQNGNFINIAALNSFVRGVKEVKETPRRRSSLPNLYTWILLSRRKRQCLGERYPLWIVLLTRAERKNSRGTLFIDRKRTGTASPSWSTPKEERCKVRSVARVAPTIVRGRWISHFIDERSDASTGTKVFQVFIKASPLITRSRRLKVINSSGPGFARAVTTVSTTIG